MGSSSSRILSAAQQCHGRQRQASHASSSTHSPASPAFTIASPPENYYSPEGLQDGRLNVPSFGCHRGRSPVSSSSVSTSRCDSGHHDLVVLREKQGNAFFVSNNTISSQSFPTGSENENRSLTEEIVDEHVIEQQTSSHSSSAELRSFMAGGGSLGSGAQGSGDVSDCDDLPIASMNSYGQTRDQRHQECERIIDSSLSPDSVGDFERRQAFSSSSSIAGETRENTISPENERENICEFAPSVLDADNVYHQDVAYSPVSDVGSSRNDAPEIGSSVSSPLVQENIAGSTNANDGISQSEGLVASSLSSQEIPSSTLGGSSDREARRNNGRRFWDALTRAASHRRSSSPITIVAIEEIDEHGSSSRWNLQQWRSESEGDHSADSGAFSLGRSLDFEERRRRVRSQVWALQRLSSGLEGLPNHSRNCPAGGQSGEYCSCEGSSPAEDTTTRASISRIIMLAEALFEVLDEIHRQSVTLSRSATVSLSSLPAPDSVVDSFPIRMHTMNDIMKVGDEVAQCYICLVEYEEGDQVRVLPCHHDYHKGCVDKWLKEVHRVCPLCRGDVCEAT